MGQRGRVAGRGGAEVQGPVGEGGNIVETDTEGWEDGKYDRPAEDD